MRLELLHSEENASRLILIFGGWSTSRPLYEKIHRRGWDTALVSDYSSLQFDKQQLKRYKTIYLYCWSMGVWAASQVLSADDVTMAFAINGTETPCDDEKGIPEKIFRGTADNLTERNLLKFRKRMCGSHADDSLLSLLSLDSSSIESLRSELYFIIDESQRASKPTIRWKRVYVGKSDGIFPPANQLRAWQNAENRAEEIIELDSPHYVDIKGIVDATIPDIEKVGKRFEESHLTYDAHAKAQSAIAARLCSMLDAENLPSDCRLLEIGPGTGLFTYLYGPLVKPGKADFIDLYPVARFGIAPEEKYYTGDAELIIGEIDESYDMIVSSSAIQWFRDRHTFFRNVASKLAQGGILLCSTFLPGTLDALDALRPSPMLYNSREELVGFLSEYFSDVVWREETISINFPDAREAIEHLRRTGVGGAFGRFGSLRKLITTLSASEGGVSLNFNVLYMYAQK